MYSPDSELSMDDEPTFLKIKRALKPTSTNSRPRENSKDLPWSKDNLRHVGETKGTGIWSVVILQSMYRGYKVRGPNYVRKPLTPVFRKPKIVTPIKETPTIPPPQQTNIITMNTNTLAKPLSSTYYQAKSFSSETVTTTTSRRIETVIKNNYKLFNLQSSF